MPAPRTPATLPNLPPKTALPAFSIFIMPPPTSFSSENTADTVAFGFLRNAIPMNSGAADNTNWTAPKNPFRLIGFSRNLVSPSKADPTRKLETLKMNLPRAASPFASRWTFSGFFDNQSRRPKMTKYLRKNPASLARAPKRPPNAFLVCSLNSLRIT